MTALKLTIVYNTRDGGPSDRAGLFSPVTAGQVETRTWGVPEQELAQYLDEQGVEIHESAGGTDLASPGQPRDWTFYVQEDRKRLESIMLGAPDGSLWSVEEDT